MICSCHPAQKQTPNGVKTAQKSKMNELKKKKKEEKVINDVNNQSEKFKSVWTTSEDVLYLPT